MTSIEQVDKWINIPQKPTHRPKRVFPKESKEEKVARNLARGEEFVQAYLKRINEEVQKTIKFMDRSGKYCALVRINPNEKLTISDDSSKQLHCVHYGGNPDFSKGEDSWTNRIKDDRFVNVFRNVQHSLLNKGYYLLDVSNPSYGKGFILKLFWDKPEWYGKVSGLWHGFNHIEEEDKEEGDEEGEEEYDEEDEEESDEEQGYA